MPIKQKILGAGQKLLFGSGWALLGKVITAISSIASAALIARLLSPEDLGTYFLMFSVVSTAVVIAQFGLNRSIVRFISEAIAVGKHAQAFAVLKGVFALGTVSTLVVCTILFVGGNQWIFQSLFQAPQINNMNFFITIWIVFLTWRGLTVGAFQGFQDFKGATVYGDSLTRIFLVILLSATWITVESVPISTVVGIAVTALGMTVISGGYSLWRRVKTLPSPSSSPLKEIATVSFPLMLTGSMIFILTQADLWIIGAYLDEKDVALYGSASRLVLMVLTPLLIVNLVIPSIIAELNAQGNKTKLERMLRAAATFAGIPAIAVLLVFMFFGDKVLHVIYGEFYATAGNILIVLSLGKMIQVWSGASTQTLAMTGNQNTLVLISLVSSCIAIGGGLLVVKPFGTVGVAFFSSLGLAIHSLLSVFLVKKRLGVRGDIQITLLNRESFCTLWNMVSSQKKGNLA